MYVSISRRICVHLAAVQASCVEDAGVAVFVPIARNVYLVAICWRFARRCFAHLHQLRGRVFGCDPSLRQSGTSFLIVLRFCARRAQKRRTKNRQVPCCRRQHVLQIWCGRRGSRAWYNDLPDTAAQSITSAAEACLHPARPNQLFLERIMAL